MNRFCTSGLMSVQCVLGALVFAATELTAAPLVEGMAQADVVILGEVHDNPEHHKTQARMVQALTPRAVVWEMLTPERADVLDKGVTADPDQLARDLQWSDTGWPEFSFYAPIFAASQGAAHYGGQVPRSQAGDVMQNGAAAFFGAEAAQYGLKDPLPAAEQSSREADQLANHCDAMPKDMLPLLVEFQRLRDAVLARAVVRAFRETGGPVVVITGNGHARTDRGIPVYLAQAMPGLVSFSLGQSEDGQISGAFDAVVDAAAVDRPDPCLAFQSD